MLFINDIFKILTINCPIITKAAPLLKISIVKYWIRFDYCKNIIKEGLESLKKSYKLYFDFVMPEMSITPITVLTAKSDEDNFFANINNSQDNTQSSSNKNQELASEFYFEKILDKEVMLFSEILSNSKMLMSIKSTRSF